MKYIHR